MLIQANPVGKALPISAGLLDRKNMLFFLREGKTYYERWPELLQDVAKRWAGVDVETEPTAGPPDGAASDLVARWLVGNADHANGGFGVAPKHGAVAAEYATSTTRTTPGPRSTPGRRCRSSRRACSTTRRTEGSTASRPRRAGRHPVREDASTNAAFVRDAASRCGPATSRAPERSPRRAAS